MGAQDSIRSFYERQYEGKQRTGSSLARVRSNLRAMSVENEDLFIDVGCGLGAAGTYLAGLGARTVGIDISFEAARLASRLGDHVAALQATAESLPFATASFDGAVLLGTLEHFLEPAKALREVVRVVKPGAQVCCVVPNSGFFLFRFLGGTGQLHERPRTLKGWSRLLQEEGLNTKAVYRDTGPRISDGGAFGYAVLRRLALVVANLLPLEYAYQFVFISESHPLGGA